MIKHFRAALAILVLSPVVAPATIVPVVNPSFETPDYTGPQAGVAVAPWFVTGQAGIVTAALASPSAGTQAAFAGADNSNASTVYQDVGALQPLTRYTLTVDYGLRGGLPNPTGAIALFNGTSPSGTLLVSDPLAPTSTTLSTATTNFLTGASVVGDLTIVLSYNSARGQMIFDNVRLDAQFIPEPSTVLLFGMGGLMLLARRSPPSGEGGWRRLRKS